MKAMIYLDANIFIYALGNVDKKTQNCINILRKIVRNEVEAYTSVLTWDEFLYSIRKQVGKQKALDESSKFLNLPNLVFLDANNEVLLKAQELSEKYNLKPRDAIHAATAIKNKIPKIISDDSDFDKIKELKRVKV
jgi:uncharacterized protein